MFDGLTFPMFIMWTLLAYAVGYMVGVENK